MNWRNARMDMRERYGEDAVRLGNIGRGLSVLAALLFVAGWITVVWSSASESVSSGPGRAWSIVSLGAYVTLATATLGLLGLGMRWFAVWIDARVTRGAP
jgi:hypothetical protein